MTNEDSTKDLDQRVSIVRNPDAEYPAEAPFHPAALYPEYPFDPSDRLLRNDVYDMVRNTLRQMGLDEGRYGTPDWNPLSVFIRPRMTVLIKPNLVLHAHPKGGDLRCLITHGSVVRAMLDYVCKALAGKGRIIIGDSPLQGTEFENACEASGLLGVLSFYRAHTGLEIRLVDFRQVHAVKDGMGNISSWREVPGDPAGYVTFDLGDDSMLAPISGAYRQFRVAKYRASDTAQYHNLHSHKYVVTASVTAADVIINLPKMKTHCKAGVTLGLKNFVGTVGRKQCLAHHREGGPASGGDEYPEDSRLKALSSWLGDRIQGNPNRLQRAVCVFLWRISLRMMKALGISFLGDGGWSGNDTVWRMTLDLARIAEYGQKDGVMSDHLQRTVFTMIDGIVAGEGEGPLEAVGKKAGVLIAGTSPAATDLAGAMLMGFDPRRIALLRNALNLRRWPLLPCPEAMLRVVVNGKEHDLQSLADSDAMSSFSPPQGWIGSIERMRT